MTHDPPKPPPQSMAQAGHHAVDSVIAGLKTQPALLAMVVLNLAMLIVFYYFMNNIAESVQSTRNQLLEMVSRCLGHDGVLDKQDKEAPHP